MSTASPLRPVPTEPAEPVYTFNITPSTKAARDHIAAAVDGDVLKLRGTLAQARDLSRDLGASIVLLSGAGRQVGRIERDGDYSLDRP